MRVLVVGSKARLFSHAFISIYPDWDTLLIGEDIDPSQFSAVCSRTDADVLVVADHWLLVNYIVTETPYLIPIIACVSTYNKYVVGQLRQRSIYPIAIPAPLDEIAIMIEEQTAHLKIELNSPDRERRAHIAAVDLIASVV